MERVSWVATVFGVFVAIGAWFFPDPLNLAPLALSAPDAPRSEAFLGVAIQAIVFFASMAFVFSMLVSALHVPLPRYVRNEEYRLSDKAKEERHKELSRHQAVRFPRMICSLLSWIFLAVTGYIAYRLFDALAR